MPDREPVESTEKGDEVEDFAWTADLSGNVETGRRVRVAGEGLLPSTG